MDSNAVEEARTRANMMPGVSKDIRLLPYTVLGFTSPTTKRSKGIYIKKLVKLVFI